MILSQLSWGKPSICHKMTLATAVRRAIVKVPSLQIYLYVIFFCLCTQWIEGEFFHASFSFFKCLLNKLCVWGFMIPLILSWEIKDKMWVNHVNSTWITFIIWKILSWEILVHFFEFLGWTVYNHLFSYYYYLISANQSQLSQSWLLSFFLIRVILIFDAFISF